MKTQLHYYAAPVPSIVRFAAWFRNTRTGLLAVAMGLAPFTPVFGQPVIITQPQSQTNAAGRTVTIAVEARGTSPLFYQWRRGSSNVAGGTNAVLVIASLQNSNAGNYTVVVTNVEGSVTSSIAFVRILSPPAITVEPTNQSTELGATATFAVTATGGLLAFQWHFNGATLPGKTSANLALADVQLTNAGHYSVVVTNAAGSATSLLARLTVLADPIIAGQPGSQAGVRGYPVNFTVVASGASPLAYQWYFSETNLPGQTNASLTLPSVGDIDAGNYFVTVTNRYGAVTSRVAGLTVGADFFAKVIEGPGSGVATSRGGAWGDYDNDGFIDLFVPQSPGPDLSARHFLYHNNRDGTFNRVTTGAVAEVASAGLGAAWGDYDNDGYLDLILVNQNQTNYLFHNNGDGSFAQVASAAIVSDIADSRGTSWVDYDNDGYLDLFRTAAGQSLRLYHNEQDGTFTRITQVSFLTASGWFHGVAWGDYNNDGRPDLFLPNDTAVSGLPNSCYRNDGGGTFTRVGARDFVGSFDGYAAAWGDYDNDGDLDLFVSCAVNAGAVSRPNLFYRNEGNDTFTILTSLPANDPANQGGASSGCTWGDYDNDGWLDLFVANRSGQNDCLYHNSGDGTFTKVLGGVAVNDGADSLAAAWGDYDNNGFLDLFVGSATGTNLLYHNNGNDNHWLKFRLVGTRSNRAAIGAKVRVHASIHGQSFWQMREVAGGDGLRGQNSLHVHFGLGNANNSDLVRIEWPSGTVQELENVASKQFLTVTEPGGEPHLAVTREQGQVQLTLTGKQRGRYALETATALPNWGSAGLTVTVTNQSGAVTFPAPDATNGAQRFYRAVWQ